MKLFALLACLLVSYVFGAPVPQEELDLDKRRESTPQILDLEEQLKKAAGEDKQYFSNPEARPIPQVDGLDTAKEKEQVLKDYVNNGDSNAVVESGADSDPGNMAMYMSMLKEFKQHPELMEDYANTGVDEQDNDDLDPSWMYPSNEQDNDKRGDSGAFAYPAENELMNYGPVIPESMYDPSDRYLPEDSKSRDKYARPDLSVESESDQDLTDADTDDQTQADTDESDLEDLDDSHSEETDEEETDEEETGDEDEDEVEESLHSLQSSQNTSDVSSEDEDQEEEEAEQAGLVAKNPAIPELKGDAPHKPWNNIGDVVVPHAM